MDNSKSWALLIIITAAEQYRNARIAQEEHTAGATRRVNDLKEFFESPWAETLCKYLTGSGSRGTSISPKKLLENFENMPAQEIPDPYKVFEKVYNGTPFENF